jgi:hypothetical protein
MRQAAVAGRVRSRSGLDSSLCVDGSGALSSGGFARALSRMILLGGLALALLMTWTGSAANAATLYTIGVLGSQGSGPGEYVHPSGIAVNQDNGKVYVADFEKEVVDVYDSAGNFLFDFGEPGTGAGQLGGAGGVAIDPSTGDVYVGEAIGPSSIANERVSKFTANGEFILMFGGGVDETTGGNVCTAASKHVCRDSTGVPGTISEGLPSVDPVTGKVLIAYSYGHDGEIRIFSSAGKYLETITAPDIQTSQVAIDDEQNIYGITPYGPLPGHGGINRYTYGGQNLGNFSPAFEDRPFAVSSLSLGAGSSQTSKTHLYASVTDQDRNRVEVAEFDLDGNLLYEHAPGLPEPGTIAVDSTTGKIYVITFNGNIWILGTPATLPKAVIKPATSITSSSATLNASINPEGTTLDTSYQFEYRKAGSSDTWQLQPADPVSVGHGTTAVDVSENIGNLDPNQQYEYKAAAIRAAGGGATTSKIAKFTTGYEAPVISLTAPSHVSDNRATLQSRIDARNAPTVYYFEYGKSPGYGSFAPPDQEGDGGHALGPVGEFEQLTELEPDTTYHFRLIATNPGGTATTGDFEFHTHTTEEEQWAPRDLELVNNPDDGNQQVEEGFAGYGGGQGESVSADGTEILYGTYSGAPGSTTGYLPLFLAKRDLNSPTGWTQQPIGIPADEQVGGGDSAYVTDVVSRDFSTYLMHTVSAFSLSPPDGDYDHAYERVTTDGDHEVLVDTLNNRLDATSISADGSWIQYYNRATKELVANHAGVNVTMPTPSCGFTVPHLEQYIFDYLNVSYYDLSRTFVQSNGNEPACADPGIYMIDRDTQEVTNIAPGGYFIRTNSYGTAVIYRGEADRQLYRWTEGGGNECLTCGKLPPGVAPGLLRVSEDLSRVYFTTNENGPCYCIFPIYELNVSEGTVKYIASAQSNVGSGDYKFTITPDGKTLVFTSIMAGTTADDTGWHGGLYEEDPDGISPYNRLQLYRYSDEEGYVECVSCPGKKGPEDGGLLGGMLFATFAVSADGSTIAYSHTSALVPEDINQGVDLYEWHNGVTRLVTNGEIEFALAPVAVPRFWGLSADGSTIVFSAGGTRVVDNELNHMGSLYAAVVGGPGFPQLNPPAHCTEDSCQGPLQASPPLDFQGSSAFRGPGSPPKRGNGKKHRHKKKHHKKKHHRRHSTREQG